MRRWIGLSASVSLFLLAAGCSESMSILFDATRTASAVFKRANDQPRIKRDAAASQRLGQLAAGPDRLTLEELQPLKRLVSQTKADGTVTLEEADQILVEMERLAASRPVRPSARP